MLPQTVGKISNKGPSHLLLHFLTALLTLSNLPPIPSSISFLSSTQYQPPFLLTLFKDGAFYSCREDIAEQVDWEWFLLILSCQVGKKIELNGIANMEIEQEDNKINNHPDFVL